MPKGRPPSAKTLVDRQLGRNVKNPVLPAGDDYIIPNHSGISSHPETPWVRVGDSARVILKNINDKVGIGTNTPGTFLHVKTGNSGTTTTTDTDIAVESDDNTGLVVMTPGDKVGFIQFRDPGGSSGIIRYNHDGDYFQWNVQAAERMRLTTTGLGVGGIPDKKFHVKVGASGSTSPSDVDMILESDDNTGISINTPVDKYGYIAFRSNGITQGSILYHDDGGYMRFSVSNNERMRLTPIGLGLGITVPAHRLDIDGSIRLTNNQGIIGTNTVGTDISIFGLDNSNNIIFGSANTANVVDTIIRGAQNIIFETNADGTEVGRFEGDGKFNVNEKAGMSPLGGHMVKLTNKTGANSVAGEIVIAHTTVTDAVASGTASETQVIGVFLEDGVSDGSEAWIVGGGIADVKADGTGWALGDRIVTSSTAKRGVANNAPSVAVHFQEIGHAVESAGANALGRVVLHFN